MPRFTIVLLLLHCFWQLSAIPSLHHSVTKGVHTLPDMSPQKCLTFAAEISMLVEEQISQNAAFILLTLYTKTRID
jgi:hypothetical protein